LQGDQLALLDAVSKVSKKTILILVHGRPQTFGLDSDRVLSQLDALYAAFRPGEEFGNAMLNLLSGTVNPSAKLSNTWPRLASHTSSNFLQRVRGKWIANEKGVMDPDGRRFDSYSASNVLPTPLFYFGYGMSYSTFLYTNLEVNLESDGGLSVMVDVKNAGKYDGVEVVQVYIMDPSGVLAYTPFWKRLVGFSRCFVGTGKMSSCHVTVMRSDLEVYDPRTRDYRVFGGVYTVRVGGSSHSDSLTKAIRMGETMNHHNEF
jgi:beta-glucosidase